MGNAARSRWMAAISTSFIAWSGAAFAGDLTYYAQSPSDISHCAPESPAPGAAGQKPEPQSTSAGMSPRGSPKPGKSGSRPVPVRRTWRFGEGFNPSAAAGTPRSAAAPPRAAQYPAANAPNNGPAIGLTVTATNVRVIGIGGSAYLLRKKLLPAEGRAHRPEQRQVLRPRVIRRKPHQ